MYIIVGLGNPTRKYEGTKHNVGFDTIDYLVDEYGIPSSGLGHKAMYGKGMIAGQKVLLAKPMTYMNLSSREERAAVDEAIGHAAKALELMLNDETDAAMNEYNRKAAQ